MVEEFRLFQIGKNSYLNSTISKFKNSKSKFLGCVEFQTKRILNHKRNDDEKRPIKQFWKNSFTLGTLETVLSNICNYWQMAIGIFLKINAQKYLLTGNTALYLWSWADLLFQFSFVEERSTRIHNAALATTELNWNRNKQFEVKRLETFQLLPF